MITAHVIRIANPLIRVPLWSLWFPFAFAFLVLTALFNYPWRLLAPSFWSFAIGIYIVGFDGMVGVPITRS